MIVQILKTTHTNLKQFDSSTLLFFNLLGLISSKLNPFIMFLF